MDSAGLAGELDRLEASLDAVAATLVREPRPAAGALESFAATLRSAHAALAAIPDAVPADTGDRLAAVRRVAALRRKLHVTARLVAGSAWYAALARELDGGDRGRSGATYGPGGAGSAEPAASSIERRA